MCDVEKTSLISCQMSFYPLYTEDCIPIVKKVVGVIKKNGRVTSSVNDLSTIIKGEREAVMELVDDVQQRMDEENIRYSMILTISNSCGCTRTG